MYIAIYTRAAQGTISDSQLDECMFNAEKLAKKMGFLKRKIKVFKDEGYSGMDIKNRPELTRLRSEIGNAHVSHVIVPDYARLSRNLADIQILVEEFEYHDVELVVCQ
ncbi:recombinase family protein [Neobacillus sp. SuZ13]|uniref:recombinase family protein n=1 Tax=Neobacillus sp. SuZ13 TaxID=3047875 RepID=UPI0024BF3720|nr:recombinase family protein [Neobacillus sp. SuZ13]WHY65385.1 recombinase family protein [Neobacillus sp. SuZ13]